MFNRDKTFNREHCSAVPSLSPSSWPVEDASLWRLVCDTNNNITEVCRQEIVLG